MSTRLLLAAVTLAYESIDVLVDVGPPAEESREEDYLVAPDVARM